MSYGDDFAGADPAGVPLDPTVLIGPDPMLWGALLLALLVAAMVGWLTARGSRPRRDDAAGAIWEAIDDVARAAMQADTDALPARASDLHRILRARLGKTLAFGGGLSGCVDALDLALKGERETAAHEAMAGHDETAAPEDEARPPSPAAVTIVSIHSPAPGGPHARRPRRPLSARERNDALRLAVAAFNDYWRRRSAREAEMRTVVAELCSPDPRRRPRLSHSAARH